MPKRKVSRTGSRRCSLFTEQKGTPIPGATDPSYEAPTDQAGTVYYYVVVTNSNPLATGNKTAAISSRTAADKVVLLSGGGDDVPGNVFVIDPETGRDNHCGRSSARHHARIR